VKQASLDIDTNMPVKLGFLTLILIGGCGIFWSANTSISGAIIAHGRFETATTPYLVSNYLGGIVGRIAVNDGESVRAGDILVQLDTSSLDLELESVTDVLTDLIARRMRLEAERDGLSVIGEMQGRPELAETLPNLERRLATQEIAMQNHVARLDREVRIQQQRAIQTELQIEGIDNQKNAISEELNILENELERQQQLQNQGWAGRSVVSNLERESLRKIAEVARLYSQKAELIQQLDEFALMEISILDRARQTAQNELDRIEPEIIELVGQRSDLLHRREQLEVRAPVDGQVYDLKVLGDGFVLSAGAPIATIIPDDGGLQAVVRVSAQDIDQLFIGQTAQVRLRAFSARSTPLISAQVVQIAGEVTTDPVTKATYFETLVRIDDISVAALDEAALVNGMEVTALVQTEAETPLEYVTRPVREYFELALRDR
jgi:HlyD family secretion protein